MAAMPLSVSSSRQPCELTTSHVGRDAAASAWTSRTAYGAPDAPVTATTTGSGAASAVFGIYAVARATSANTRNTMLITPFIVKNAASSRDRSSSRTSECS